MTSILILGAGYTGSRLAHRLKDSGDFKVTATTRSHSGPRFDLLNHETWANLPKAEACFWMFPAVPLKDVETFLAAKAPTLGKIIIVGSTSGFRSHQADEEVNEKSELNPAELRVQGEEAIRKRGGIVVRASGIYGPTRNPVDWVRSGRVVASSKFVNLIHVEDLVSILLAALERGVPGSHYLASDSAPMRWNELIEIWNKEFSLNLPTKSVAESSEKTSKQVRSAQSLKELNVTLKYPTILEGARDLEKK